MRRYSWQTDHRQSVQRPTVHWTTYARRQSPLRSERRPPRPHRSDLVFRDDEREDLAQLQAELTAELDPSGPTETLVFAELLHAAWNLRLFRRIEAELSTGSPADFASDGVNTAALDP